MELNMKVFHDPYLRNTKDIECPIGLTPFEAARIQPGPSISRTFEKVRDEEQRDYPKQPDLILTTGCAVGLDESGNVQHFYAGRGLSFVGFLQGQTATRAAVKTGGSIILKIEGTTDENRHAPVFCVAPNVFTLKRARGAAEIGVIRYVQENRVAVAFRRYDSEKPLDLRLT